MTSKTTMRRVKDYGDACAAYEMARVAWMERRIDDAELARMRSAVDAAHAAVESALASLSKDR